MTNVDHMLPVTVSAAVAAGVASRVTPLAVRLARRLGVMDRPETGTYKLQPAPVPALGSLPVAASAGLGTLAGHLVAPGGRGAFHSATRALTLATAAGTLGVVDDVRPLPWAPRLAATAGLGLVGWWSGFRFADAAGPPGAVATLMWASGTANAFNLIDNMDGVAAGTAVAAGAALTVLASGLESPGPAVTSAALAGAAAGFRVHNRHPARIYLGDGGALFLGTALAMLALEVTSPSRTGAHWASPVVLLGLPLFDTAFVTVTRLRRSLSPFVGGHDHSAHRLATIGLPVPAVARALTGVSGVLGAAGVVVARSRGTTRAVTLGMVAAAAAAAAAALAMIPAEPPATDRRAPAGPWTPPQGGS